MALKTTEFVTNNMVIVPNPPYSPDLAPSDIALFTQLKVKLKDDVLKQCLTSKENRKRYSTSLRKMTSPMLLKRGKKRRDRYIRSKIDFFEGDDSQNWRS
jgi:hypothetical protein